jgi:hypothetical protein
MEYPAPSPSLYRLNYPEDIFKIPVSEKGSVSIIRWKGTRRDFTQLGSLKEAYLDLRISVIETNPN